VLTRPGCHLCEDAKETIAAVCAEVGVQWLEQDITGDAELTRRYTDQIPVTFVDGRQHDFWRVDADRLRAALSKSLRPAVTPAQE
jgi:glutaredoxin